jgi:ABC-type ATPase with predicted acetyltransferase domain
VALLKCKECGQSISESAKACPHCGNPIVTRQNWRGCLFTIILIAGFIWLAVAAEKATEPSKPPATSTNSR